MPRGRRPRWPLALGALALLALVALAGQLLLPRLAERSVRVDLERDGAVVRAVHVRAVPAWTLLAGRRADAVAIDLRSVRARAGAPGALNGLLEQVQHVHRVDLGIDALGLDLGAPLGSVGLGPIRVRIRGAELRADVSAPLRGLTGALLPRLAAGLRATGGRLVLGTGAPLGLLDVVLVDAVHLQVRSVRTRRVGDALTVTVDGRRD